MYNVNNMLPLALAVHEIYRDIFGPPMLVPNLLTTCTRPTCELVDGLFADMLSFEMFSCVFRTLVLL